MLDFNGEYAYFFFFFFSAFLETLSCYLVWSLLGCDLSYILVA